jgi:hypothetical protein
MGNNFHKDDIADYLKIPFSEKGPFLHPSLSSEKWP